MSRNAILIRLSKTTIITTVDNISTASSILDNSISFLEPVPVVTKAVKVDFQNYESAMKNFLETFKENLTDENVKYSVTANTFILQCYNCFHVFIKKFNPNVAGLC